MMISRTMEISPFLHVDGRFPFIIGYHPGHIRAFSVFVPLRYTLRVYPSQDTVLRPSLSGTHTPHVHQYIKYFLMW